MSRNRDQDKDRWSLQAGKLAVLRAAVDDAARHVRGLYFTFLLFAFYVAVIVFSTDDEQLLTGTGAELPLLGVELPLLGFYMVVPWLVLIFHVHLLSQFYLLSRKLFDLDHELGSLPSESARIQRGLLFPLIFSHRIVGSQHPRLIRWVFGSAVVVTILLTPVLLLGAVQYKFLPYHSEWITLIHQLVLTLDLALLWIFWPRLSSRSWHWRDWWSRSWCMWGVWVSTVLGVLVSTILLLGVWTLLVPPHSGIEREWLIGYRPWLNGVIHRNLVLSERTLMRKEPPAELLFDAYQDTKEGRARVWLEAGEALDLRGWDLCDWDRCAEGQCEPDLCRRDLRYADFSDSDLWDADLRGAQLQSAALEGAQLQGAVLSGAELEGADLREAMVYGTDFQDTELSLADLRDLCSLPVGWGRPPGSESLSSEPEWELFSEIEELEARLEQAGKHWPQEGRKRVERAIERFWSSPSTCLCNPRRSRRTRDRT